MERRALSPPSNLIDAKTIPLNENIINTRGFFHDIS
jgi:hypothetical protein